MKNQKKRHARPEKIRASHLATLVVLVVLVAAATVVMVRNGMHLREAVDERTGRYVSDVSTQLAKDIDYRLSKITMDLESIVDSLIRFEVDDEDNAAIKEFLNRKAKKLGFTSMVVLGTDGRLYQTVREEEDFFSLPGVQDSFQGMDGVSFLGEQSILYSCPIRLDDQVVGVLGGIRDKENMQKLIQSDNFSDESLTCIIDCTGKVVISPTELAPFLQLDHIFTKNPDGQLARDIQQMEINMETHQPGLLWFQAVDDSDLILAYNSLESYDWVLLSLVPSDVIASRIDGYLNHSFLIVGGVLLLMAVVLALLFAAYRHLQRTAFVDRVTGGMNNAAFQMQCRRLLPGSPPGTYAVAVLNIKQFKLINEYFGSEAGNQTLQFVMDLLNRRLEPERDSFAARASADLFYLCLRCGDPKAIQQQIQEIVAEAESEAAAMNWRSQNNNTPFRLVLQPGVYLVDEPDLEITVIQDRANTACRDRLASEDGVCKFYHISSTRRLQREKELNDLFGMSLEQRDFQVYLQPKVWAESGALGGAEALVRWIHPQKGMIYPSDFIPLFEANGNICRLDLYVFEEVCRTIQRWQAVGEPLFPISVNLSRQHFQKPDCLESLQEIARRYQIPDGILELELTESVFFDDQSIEHMKTQIQEMHRMGFRCSLDDFGAGYSSLGLLMEFDVDTIKLDRRFFLDVSKPKARYVVESIVDLARKIGARTIGEGIETDEQLEFLRHARCDMVQGYIYSRPVPIQEFEAWKEGRVVER